MNALAEIQIENKSDVGLVVSSRVVADELGRRHSDIINQIEKLLENENVRSLIIPSQYQVAGQNRKYKEYLLTKDGFTFYMFNIQGYSDFKMAYINRFNEMEKQISKPIYSYMIEDPKERAKKWIEEQEQREQLELENKAKEQQIGELKPKADYYDQILKSKILITINAIAKDYGMSAQAMNKLLNEFGVQYKQSGQWLLYAKYHAKGYTSSEPHEYVKTDGSTDFKMHTKWNQKGRIFIYNLLKVNEIYDSKDIKSLDIKFEQSDRLLNFIERRNDLNADNSVIFDAVQNVSDFMKNVGGNVADLKISKGRLKKNSLSNDDMKNLIDLLLPIASEIFLSLKVKYLSPSNTSKVIDLVDYGKYSTIYNRDDDSDGWEYIADKIEEIYEEKYRAEIGGHNTKIFKKGSVNEEKLKLS